MNSRKQGKVLCGRFCFSYKEWHWPCLWNKQSLALGELFYPALESHGRLGWVFFAGHVPGTGALALVGQPLCVPLAYPEGMFRNELAGVVLSVPGPRIGVRMVWVQRAC